MMIIERTKLFLWIGLIVLWFSAGVVGSAIAADQPLQGILASDLQQAKIYLKAKNWKNLEDFSKEWAKRDRGNWKSWFYYGLALHRQNKLEEASRVLPRAIKLSPDKRVDIIRLNADLQKKLKKYQAAEKSYRVILEIEKNNAEVWAQLLSVVTLQMTTQATENEATYRNTSNLYKKILIYGEHINNKAYWSEYGALLEKLGEDDKQREANANVLRLDARNIEVLEWVYRYDKKQGNATALAKTTNHLRRLVPEHPYLNLDLARQAWKDRNYSNARFYYELVAKNQKYKSERAESLTAIGDINAKERKNKKEVIKYYLDAIRSDPKYLPAWQKIIIFYRTNAQPKLSEKYLTRMLQVEKKIKNNETFTLDIIKF